MLCLSMMNIIVKITMRKNFLVIQPARRSTNSFNHFPTTSLRLSSFDDSLRRSSSSISIPSQNLILHSWYISNLLEYTYILEEAQIAPIAQHLINSYSIFKRQKHSIKQLISPLHIHTKEFIQTIGVDQCLVSATPAEQYITLEILQDFINH